MQPQISAGQIDLTTAFDGRLQQYEINTFTKTNAFQEVFIGGVIVAVYQADNTTNPDQFEVAGDYTGDFGTGVVFHVSGSASNDGDYTTVAPATFAAGYTTIYVTDGSITTNEGAGSGTGFISTGTRLELPDNCSALIAAYSTARDTTGVFGAGQIDRAVFARGVGAATITIIGAQQTDFAQESLSGTPDVQLSADTVNGSIKIELKGGSTTLIKWQVYLVLNSLVL